MVYLACTPADFHPTPPGAVRWLDRDADYALAQSYWQVWGQELTHARWLTAHTYGFQYAAGVESGQVIASAGVWRYAAGTCDVVAVSTQPPYRRQGHARQVVAFVTAYILAAGRVATCFTGDGNAAMLATAHSLGFRVVPPDRVWWQYPSLPDF